MTRGGFRYVCLSVALVCVVVFCTQCFGVSTAETQASLPAPEEVATTTGVSASLSSVSSSATTSATTNIATLVKTRAVARALVPRRIQTDLEVPDTTVECNTGGEFTFGGSMSIDAANDGGSGSIDGSFDIGFSTCTEVVTVPTSDGECEVTTALDGDMIDDFTGSFTLDLATDSLTSYEFISIANTPTPMTISIDGESHTVELTDYTLTISESDPTGSISGTITVDDGDDVSAADVSSEDFTMAELCP